MIKWNKHKYGTIKIENTLIVKTYASNPDRGKNIKNANVAWKGFSVYNSIFSV